ncbi:hypothetical protein F511_05868 [Dorcoceras hygrometricum]|uniref:Uncharacterized protein n=1 Tax=Dorcoceras hygrometricum TaxID=472368 RepID=A0A2Z7CWQ8_9LAMI|nr:hypothetical protein F511_05868 [Dorcoceras hygrometricum]
MCSLKYRHFQQLVHQLPAAGSSSSSWFIFQQLLTADCDDITVDVIIADPSTDSADVTAANTSCCLLILLTSSSP